MSRFIPAIVCFLFSVPLFAAVDDSILPFMDGVYTLNVSKKLNSKQREMIESGAQRQSQKLRVMSYNMLYNAKEAEDKLPLKHRWDCRKLRMSQYVAYAKADIIGAQELQDDQVREVAKFLGAGYSWYGKKTRENEGRTDTNAIFFNTNRLELLDSQTVAYSDPQGQNAFTHCRFRDKVTNKHFSVLNTKLTWADTERRLAEATQLYEYASHLPTEEAVLLTGDFNTFPFTQHQHNPFLDGEYVQKVLTGSVFKDAQTGAIFGHCGPTCTITNAQDTLEPFAGAQLSGFILDHIFVNDRVTVLVQGIDTAKVWGEYPSDHFPVIADIVME